MNYLELINNFWIKDIEYNFSDRETALYFYMLNVCNSIHWRNPFGLSNAIVTARFTWGRTSFERSRNRLQSAGLIDFQKGDGRGKISRYTLMEKVHKKDIHLDTLSGENTVKVYEKDTHPDTHFDEKIQKMHEKDACSDTLSEHLLLSNGLYLQGFQNASKHKQKDISHIKKIINEEDKRNKEIREIDAEKEKNVMDMYHRICISFPRVTKITVSRKEKIRRRLAEMGGLPVLEDVFLKMEASLFLKGNNSKGWSAGFDWVFENPDNWLKIIEGNYDNKQAAVKYDPRFSGILQTDLNKF